MDTHSISEIIEKIAHYSDLNLSDIPNLDLYMDQILTLFDSSLSNNKRYPNDKLLTKTMINNYSKANIITPVTGKKYSKEQIIQILLIYYLKNSLTIQEIKRLNIPKNTENDQLVNIYKVFSNIKNKINENLDPFLTKLLSDFKLDLSDNNRLLTILFFSYLSTRFTNILQTIIDEYYPETVDKDKNKEKINEKEKKNDK